MTPLLCEFAVCGDGLVCCTRPGCKNRLRATDPTRCRATCKSVFADRDVMENPCKFLGAATDETHQCKGCSGSKRVHAKFECSQHERCLPLITVKDFRCCTTCLTYEAKGDDHD